MDLRPLLDVLVDEEPLARAATRLRAGRAVVLGVPVRDPERVADWVLSRPPPAERALLDAAVERAADAVEFAAAHGLEAAMRHFNRVDGTGPAAGEDPPPQG